MENKQQVGFRRLESNLIDVIKESQIKLGYDYGSLQFFYPVVTLNHLLGTDLDSDKMQEYLDAFDKYAGEKLGKVEHAHRKDRFSFKVSADGVKYVHEEIDTPKFLVELIELTAHHGCTFDAIFALFHKYSDDVICEKMNNGEFDYMVRFAKDEPDDYRYCFHEEGEHIIYHRFKKEDYDDFAF